MIQFNECTKNPTDKTRLRWLLVIRWGIFVIGCLALLHTLIHDERPVPNPVVFNFTSVVLWVAGIIAILTSWTVGIISERIIKQREINELKSEIQELKNILAQK